MRIYTEDSQVTELAVILLFMAVIFQLSDGLQVGALGALRGLKDTRIPLFTNLFSYMVIGLPGAYLLGIQWGFGPVGLWTGIIVGLSLAAFLHNLRFHLLTRHSHDRDWPLRSSERPFFRRPEESIPPCVESSKESDRVLPSVAKSSLHI